MTNRVSEAVDRVFRIATSSEATTLSGLMEAVARDRSRPLIVDPSNRNLPLGVFGQWVQYPDRDEVSCAEWVHARERTLAHELGHILLGHRGRPARDFAEEFLPASAQGLAKIMLRRECSDGHNAEEIDAEAFASRLLGRLNSNRKSTNPGVRARLDEAIR